MVLVDCRQKKDAPSNAPPQKTDAATVPSASASSAPTTQQDEIITMTMAWNDALARRDAPALRRVYGAKVRLYAENLDLDAVIARKAAAFKSTPDYTQSIRSLKVDRSQPDRPTVEFLKTWRASGKENTIRGVLVFGFDGDTHPVIYEESDVATDAKRLAALKDEGCYGLLHQVVYSTASGRAYHGHDASTMIACTPPECTGFEVAAGRFGGPSMTFHREATFEINHKTGAVSEDSVPTAADPTIVARMKTACAAEYP